MTSVDLRICTIRWINLSDRSMVSLIGLWFHFTVDPFEPPETVMKARTFTKLEYSKQLVNL